MNETKYQRMPQIMAFREGFSILKFSKMIKEHLDLCHEHGGNYNF